MDWEEFEQKLAICFPQPRISPETVGTSQPQQQITNDIDTINAQKADVVSVGGAVNVSGVGNTVNVNCSSQGSSSRKRPRSVDIDDLDCTKLKRYFKNSLCRASPLPWYPEHTWNIQEVYTDLALKGSVNNFGVNELFKQRDERFPEEESYRILIEGDAGYGKSTLMLKIASDWSNTDSKDKTNYTSRFSLLLVVKLGYVGKDENLLSYMENFYYKNIMKMDTPLEDVLESDGAKKVMILLDGYDEANDNTKKEVDRIMKKEKMMDCHVVLTSRFGHAPDAVKSKALRVTVKGFGREQVKVAVGKFFIKARHLTKEDVISCIDELSTLNNVPIWLRKSIVLNRDDFQSVQEIFPLLPEEKRLGLDQFKIFMKKVHDDSPYKELARCPLLCIMLCCLVSECPNSELPSTCSGLYFAMINRNLYRAARKKAEAAGEDEEQWDLRVLDGRIRQGHESYLQDFGRLCINGLKTRSMSFRLCEITEKKEAAKTTDVKVTKLIEAGVLVQDFTELNTKEKISRYQVPHRTTAEFLAAYYLSGETDQNLMQQNLLDLFRLRTSFNEVGVSLIEMGKLRFLVDAFSVIKFPSDCLTDIPFMKSYFTQHGAAGTWSEFKDALPNELPFKTMGHDIIVSTPEPCLTLLELFEEFGKMDTGNTNALRSLQPADCPVSLHVKETPNLPILLHTLVKSGVVLNFLKFDGSGSIFTGEMLHEVTRSLQELLKAGSCPVQLSFTKASQELLLAVTEAMQEVPEACRLRSFEFLPHFADTSPLTEVLAEKWLSHLEHLGISSVYKDNRTVEPLKASSRDSPPGNTVHPILKGLTEPGCSLTSLHLCFSGDLLFEDLMMLATKLVTLRLEIMHLFIDVTKISNYALKEKCSLKSLHLKIFHLFLEGSLPSADENKELLLGWRNVATSLEELTIDDCEFPVELLSWLNLSVPNLRTLSIGRVVKRMPKDDTDKDSDDDTDKDSDDDTDKDSDDDLEYSYADELLEALTRSSGESIEELSLLSDFWVNMPGDCEELEELILHPIREALQRCPRMRKVKPPKYFSFGIHRYISVSIDEEALTSDNICLALLKIVLSVPMLQTLTMKYFFMDWEKIGTFGAIADEAKKRPGQRFDSECNALRLHGLSNENACHAMHVFRERKLEYRLRYVADEVYELWFPV